VADKNKMEDYNIAVVDNMLARMMEESNKLVQSMLVGMLVGSNTPVVNKLVDCSRPVGYSKLVGKMVVGTRSLEDCSKLVDKWAHSKLVVNNTPEVGNKLAGT
jgi:hypothetical protein